MALTHLRALPPALLLAVACNPSPQRTSAATATPAQTTLTLATASDQWVTVGDLRLRYREIGEGPPVVLLHGYTDNLAMWNGPADSLARDHRVIVPDLRGFGESSKSGDPGFYGQQMVDDVVRLLDHLNLPDAHLIGYSMGGIISANVAVRYPARVRTVTFAAGAFFQDSAETRSVMAYAERLANGEGLAPFFKWILPTWPDSMITAILPSLVAQNDSGSLVASIRGFMPLQLDSLAIDQSRIPATSVVSETDPLAKGARFLVRHWPGKQLVVLPRGDHADIHLAPELLEAFRAQERRVLAAGR